MKDYIMSSNTELATIVAFARRKGFVYPSSEIYGGYAATYDFGPLGFLLKKNIEKAWRLWNVTTRDDVVEIEGAIFLHPKVWKASGHIGGFSDLLVEDIVTNKRYRADHLIEDAHILENAGSLKESEVDDLIVKHGLKSPDGNELGNAKKFNLLVTTHLGPVEDDASVAYLKGESCQNIYVDWKQIQETTRRKLPFGVAQIGKAFRNEITVKQYLFRTREFEQMDVQYFVKPGTEDEWYANWKQNRFDFYTKQLGFDAKHIKWRQHDKDELVFYAKDAWDVEYEFGVLGFKEMEGVHNRTDYDTRVHQEHSGTNLEYFDESTSTKYLPYIVEMSAGFNRIFLATLFEFYKVETVTEGDERIVLALPVALAPYRYAVLPLMKKDGLSELGKEIQMMLKLKGLEVDYDDAGSVGKRYRRQDENGTPECITVDYTTLEDGTVTVRDRDTMNQIRINWKDLV
jgi:glycyl-tRNA synthetase